MRDLEVVADGAHMMRGGAGLGADDRGDAQTQQVAHCVQCR